MVLRSGRLCIQTTDPLCFPGPTANFPCADFRDLRMFNMLSFYKISQFPVFLPDREFFFPFSLLSLFSLCRGYPDAINIFFSFFFQTTPHHLTLIFNRYAPDGDWCRTLMNAHRPVTLGFRDDGRLVERWASL